LKKLTEFINEFQPEFSLTYTYACASADVLAKRVWKFCAGEVHGSQKACILEMFGVRAN